MGPHSYRWLQFRNHEIICSRAIFLSGSVLYLYREKIPDSGAIALGASVLFLAGLVIPVGYGAPYYQTSVDLTVVFFAYPLLWLGIHLPFTRVSAVNDYSYGIYIYAFPVQQILVVWGVNKWGYWATHSSPWEW